MAKETKKAAPVAANEKEAAPKQDFFAQHSKLIYTLLLLVLAVIVVVYFLIQNYEQNKNAAANAMNAPVEHLNRAIQSGDSLEFRLALEGTEEEMGFLQILDEYGAKGGESIYLDIAICELNLGLFDDAIEHASEYDSDDELMSSRALSLIGNAYMEKEAWADAKENFLKAADLLDSEISAYYLYNAGLAAEKLGQKEEALNLYKKIEARYPAALLATEQIYPGQYYEGSLVPVQIARLEAELARDAE